MAAVECGESDVISLRQDPGLGSQVAGGGTLALSQKIPGIVRFVLLIVLTSLLYGCGSSNEDLVLSRSEYEDRLRAFWLSQSIANWTGLQTEGERTSIPYYTDNDWEDFGGVFHG